MVGLVLFDAKYWRMVFADIARQGMCIGFKLSYVILISFSLKIAADSVRKLLVEDGIRRRKATVKLLLSKTQKVNCRTFCRTGQYIDW